MSFPPDNETDSATPFSRVVQWDVSLETSFIVEAPTAVQAIEAVLTLVRWPSGRRRTVVIAEPIGD